VTPRSCGCPKAGRFASSAVRRSKPIRTASSPASSACQLSPVAKTPCPGDCGSSSGLLNFLFFKAALQIAAPLHSRTPKSTGRIYRPTECGWKKGFGAALASISLTSADLLMEELDAHNCEKQVNMAANCSCEEHSSSRRGLGMKKRRSVRPNQTARVTPEKRKAAGMAKGRKALPNRY
jgi:hypothetical protein